MGTYLIVVWISFAAGFSVAGLLFKRYYKNVLNGMLFSVHHQGFNVRSKRIRGLINLLLPGMLRIMNYLDLLSKPLHQEYSKLAIQELEEALALVRIMDSELRAAEKEILDNAKKYE